VPNFVSFLASVAELAHGENRVLTHSLNTQSISQSLTQLIWCPKNRSFRFRISDIQTLWHSALSARVSKYQKLKM